MTIALCKAVEFWRVCAGFKGFGLVKILMRDQAIYFLVYVISAISYISIHDEVKFIIASLPLAYTIF